MAEQSAKPVLLDFCGQLAVNLCSVFAEPSANLRNLFDPVQPPLDRFFRQYFKAHVKSLPIPIVDCLRRNRPALSFNDPHCPAGHDHSSDEEHEAVSSVAEHFPGGIALRNSEDNGRAECEQHGGAKVRKFQGHCFFPLAMW
jgi:hypothetical protein